MATKIHADQFDDASFDNKVNTTVASDGVSSIIFTSVASGDTATIFGTNDAGTSNLHIRLGNESDSKITLEHWDGSTATVISEFTTNHSGFLGDVKLTGGIHFSESVSGDAKVALYKGGTEFAILRRYGDDYTILQIWAPDENWFTPSEATLSLVRGNEPNQEYIDLYTINYAGDEARHGIRIQKRGSGQYRPFVFEQSDGSSVEEIMRIKADKNIEIVNNLNVGQSLQVNSEATINSDAQIKGNLTVDSTIYSQNLNISNSIYIPDDSINAEKINGLTGVGPVDVYNIPKAAPNKGYIALSLTNYDNNNLPAIAAGAEVELNREIIKFDTETAINGAPTSGSTNYIYINSSDLKPYWTTTAPTWSSARNGWYDSGDSNRYIGGCYYDGTNYKAKWVYSQTNTKRNEGNIVFEGYGLSVGYEITGLSINADGGFWTLVSSHKYNGVASAYGHGYALQFNGITSSDYIWSKQYMPLNNSSGNVSFIRYDAQDYIAIGENMVGNQEMIVAHISLTPDGKILVVSQCVDDYRGSGDDMSMQRFGGSLYNQTVSDITSIKLTTYDTGPYPGGPGNIHLKLLRLR